MCINQGQLNDIEIVSHYDLELFYFRCNMCIVLYFHCITIIEINFLSQGLFLSFVSIHFVKISNNRMETYIIIIT